jgi:DNA-directed RNA polymerase specialized sigma24 family protein
MDVLPCKAGCGAAGPDSPDGIREAYARILQACVFAGLALPDAEDVAQDLFLWLLRSGPVLVLPAMPWLAAAAQNFIRRNWRQRRVRRQREALAVAEAAVFARGDGAADSVEVRLSLDRIERRLPEVEAKLLHLVRTGCSFPEAITALKIPRGSRSFFRKRLVSHLAEGLRAPASKPVATGRQRAAGGAGLAAAGVAGLGAAGAAGLAAAGAASLRSVRR